MRVFHYVLERNGVFFFIIVNLEYYLIFQNTYLRTMQSS